MSRVDDAVARAAQGTSVVESGTPLPEVPPDELWEPEPDEAEPAAAAQVEAGAVETDAKLLTEWKEPRSVEQYRRLAARLHLRQAEQGIKVVMIGSALPGEGKTLTAANLAVTLSHSYHRQVLLIDADLRRPWLHRLFGVPNVSGLNDGVLSNTTRKIPLIRLSDRLTLVTAGRPESDPMRVLSSERMKQVLGEAAEKFDWVIIDTPPIGLITDANLLAALVDTVILVVEAGRTPHRDVSRAVQAIGRDAIFGVVLNRTQARERGYEYDHYYGAKVAG